MKIWLLVAFIVLLLLMGVREKFEATDKIKDPSTWDEVEYERIRNMVIPGSTLGEEELQSLVGGFFVKWRDATYRITINDINRYLEEPPRRNLSADKKAEARRIIEAYYIDQGQSIFEQAAGYVSGYLGQNTEYQYKPPICPPGYTLGNDGSGKCKTSDRTKPTFVNPECPEDYSLTFDNPPRCRNPNATPPTTTAGTTTSGSPPTATTSTPPASEEYIDPICPTGTSLDSRKRCRYPGEPQMFTCPSGYVKTAGGVCRKSGSMEEIPGQCPSGHILEGMSCIRIEQPTCPSGYTLRSLESENACFRPAGTSGTPSGTTAPAAAAAAPAGTYDSTTGGTTSFYSQPNSGTAGLGQRLFGPEMTGRGPSDGRNAVNTTGTTPYPELLGGIFEPSTRIEGVGVVGPSQNWRLGQSGDLPSACSLGAEERSAFFPFSRCPGDRDLVPDPYRVSQTYSAASYGSKTEPVPFLTDFSAFLK
jgi:hypothetical protein